MDLQSHISRYTVIIASEPHIYTLSFLRCWQCPRFGALEACTIYIFFCEPSEVEDTCGAVLHVHQLVIYKHLKQARTELWKALLMLEGHYTPLLRGPGGGSGKIDVEVFILANGDWPSRFFFFMKRMLRVGVVRRKHKEVYKLYSKRASGKFPDTSQGRGLPGPLEVAATRGHETPAIVR